jgi:excisionase family DNA binding protein
MTNPGDYISTRHAARILDCHINTVRRLLIQGKLEGRKIGGRRKVYRPALEAMLEPCLPVPSTAPAKGTDIDAQLAALGAI